MREPRKYQKQAVNDLLGIFNKFPKDQRAFLKLPTGTGKTWTAFFFLQEYYKNKPVRVVWTAHQNDLVDQAKSDLCDFLQIEEVQGRSVKFGNIKIDFITWQGLTVKQSKYDLLIIDEVHCGSSNAYGNSKEKREHSSFQSIMKLAPAHVYISATPWELNAKLYPKLLQRAKNSAGKIVQVIKPERKTEYTLQQAFDDKVIVNTQFLCVQTVDTIRLRDLEKENSFNNIEDLASFVKENNVNIKDIKSRKALNTAILESMLEVYFTKEVSAEKFPQTMIFCKGKNGIDDSLSVENVVKAVKKLALKYKSISGIKLPSGKSLVRMATSTTKGSSDTLKSFKLGEFPILCVVGMAREGYNAPACEVLIDLAHSTENMRLLVQKVGRGLRTFEGKTMSKFYYPDILDNYLKVRGTNMQINSAAKKRIEEAVLNASPDATPEMIEAAEKAIVNSAKVTQEMVEVERIENQFDGVEAITGKFTGDKKKKTITVSSTSLLIDEAIKLNPLKNIDTSWLFDKMEVVSSNQTNWEFFESLDCWEELVRMCVKNKGMLIEEAYNEWVQK